MVGAAWTLCERLPRATVHESCSALMGPAPEPAGVGHVGTAVGILRVGVPTAVLAWLVVRFTVDGVQLVGCLRRRCRRAAPSATPVVSVGTQIGGVVESDEAVLPALATVWVSGHDGQRYVTPQCPGLLCAATRASARTPCPVCPECYEGAGGNPVPSR